MLPDPADYAEEALAARATGLKAYKLHTPGRSFEEDLLAHRLVREAIGDDAEFKLMSDPVADFNLEQAIRFGRALEKLNYHWLEEPRAAAIHNCEFFELLGPFDSFNFGLAEPFPIRDGVAYLPTKPGLGIDLDWDEIEACTLAVV